MAVNPPKHAKTFVPLENNPVVFNHLVHTLGLSPDLVFHDIYSLDLVHLIPRPVHALILICPGAVYHKVRSFEAAAKSAYTGGQPDEPIVWFRQTIGHACGLIGLIHAVANGGARTHLAHGSILDRILREAAPLQNAQRADVLYNSQELEDSHAEAAQLGDTAAPEDPEAWDEANWFITFVKGRDGHLWELTGEWEGPLDRGALDDSEDMISSKALALGVKRHLAVAEEQQSIGFSLIALAPKSE